MGVNLTKDSIDLGIVVKDAAASLAFYRDVLGFEDLGESPMPGGTMHRLVCGTSQIKLVSPRREPRPRPARRHRRRHRLPLLDDLGVEPRRGRGGVRGGRRARSRSRSPNSGRAITIAIVEDPDGNWVEFLGTS